jgi:hypothetical protein
MTLYSKLGSIPYPYTDGTEGWIEVPDEPVPPEGKEVVWWYPPGWVIRDPQPPAQAGYIWAWSQTQGQWNEYPIVQPTPPDPPVPTPTGSPTVSFTVNSGTSADTITLSST